MSRIFDALRKAESRPAPSPTPPAVPASTRPGGPPAPGSVTPLPPPSSPGAFAAHPQARGLGGAPASHVPVQHATVVAALPEPISREMTTLRVNLETALQERVPRAVAFVSAQGGEGTSTVAAEFVMTLISSDARTRVLFADANALRPALVTGPSATGPLAGLFAEAGDPRGLGSVDLLPLPEAMRGTGGYTPSDLEAALDAVGGRYDWIVIDGPPVLYASESSTLAALADGVVIVVEAGRTKKPVLARCVDMLRKAGARVLGSVLNRRQLEIPEFIYRRI